MTISSFVKTTELRLEKLNNWDAKNSMTANSFTSTPGIVYASCHQVPAQGREVSHQKISDYPREFGPTNRVSFVFLLGSFFF